MNKIKFCAALLTAALSVTLLVGCSAGAVAPDPRDIPPVTQAEPIQEAAPAPTEAPALPPIPTEAPAPASKEESKPTEPPAQVQEEKPNPTEPQRLTKEEAISIALADAGLGRDQVTGLRVEFDYDGGVPEYEVDFRHGGYEYDYEIHAETGAIRSRDKDRED